MKIVKINQQLLACDIQDAGTKIIVVMFQGHFENSLDIRKQMTSSNETFFGEDINHLLPAKLQTEVIYFKFSKIQR